MPFGADWGLESGGTNILDARYLLKTDDGAFISLNTAGTMTMETDILENMMAEDYTDPSSYYFREHLFFETGDVRYQWLNSIIAFAVMGITENGNVCYDAYIVK